MRETTIDIELLLKQRLKARKMMNKWSIKIDEIDNLIRENCTHTKTATTKSYVEGGYLNVGEYHTHKKCIICNKEIDHKVEYGSYA